MPRRPADMSRLCPQGEPGPAAPGRRSSLSGVCYLTMGLLVLLLGLVFASMYVYRYFFITQVGETREALLAPSGRAARPPWREVLLGFVVLHCGNSAARLLLGTADEAFFKWYPQADLQPQCQEGPSGNPPLPFWLCFAFFLTA